MMRFRNICVFRRAVTAAALSVTIGAPAMAEHAVTDATGQRVVISDRSRVVAIGGAITEIIYALGLEPNVVAVDSTSVHPPRALADKPNVGYMRQLSPEGVLALSPTLILAAEGAGPPEAVAVLKAARAPFVLVPDRYSFRGVVDKVRLVAEALGERARGDCLVAALNDEFARLDANRAAVARRARVLFILSFIDGRAMVGGVDTAADSMIRLAGAENALSGFSGYKLVNDEAIVAAQPDAVLMMERPGQPASTEDVLARPSFATTPAAANNRLIVMNGQYLLGFGPRMALAAQELAARLYQSPGEDGLAARHDEALERCRR